MITFDTKQLGPLEVCVDPALLLWNREPQKRWRPAVIRIIAAMIDNPCAELGIIADAAGMSVSALYRRLSEMRRDFEISGLPISIETIRPDRGRICGYQLKIGIDQREQQ